MNKPPSNNSSFPASEPRKLKRLGQVFLRDHRAAARIISSLKLQPDDSVLEIGGGDGRLSALIAPRVRRLVVVELDPRFVDVLERRFAGAGNVRIVSGDILAPDVMAAVREAEPDARMIVYGSLPYYITSPILRWIAGRPGDFSRSHLLVQREVAQRAAAPAGSREYGFLSVMLQRRAKVSLGPIIARGSFSPVPKVDSQLLTLVPRSGIDLHLEDRMELMVSVLFEQRRKKLRNTLRSFLGRKLTPAFEERCADEGLPLDKRPEDLSPDDLYRLFLLVEECNR